MVKPKGWAWKLYFYFAVLMTVCSISVVFWGDEEIHMQWWEWVYIPLYLLEAVSLFGFVYSRRIASPKIWQALFVATVIYEIWNAYDMGTTWTPLAPPVVVAVVFTFVYLVQMPMWYGNFLYGFRCKELWHGKA